MWPIVTRTKQPYNKYMERLKKRQRNPYLLFVGVSGYFLLAAYVNVFPPDAPWRIGIFIIAFAFSTWMLLRYLFKNTRQPTVFTIGLATILVLRFLGLRHPLYPLLLVASIIAFELNTKKGNNTK